MGSGKSRVALHGGVACLFLFLGGCYSPSGFQQKIYSHLLDKNFAERLESSQEEDFLGDLPKISTHEHYQAGGKIETYLVIMKALGIRKVIFVPTGAGPDNRGYQRHMSELLEIAKKYPEIIPYATVDEADPRAPSILEEAVKEGARGLKLIGCHPHFYDEPLDSPPMRALFEKVRVLKIPVLIHISPIKIPKQMPEFENLLKAFPDVIVVAAHYARGAPHFAEGARLLDTYPNLYMDVSMGGGLPRYKKEIQLFARNYREFILQYQDRLMWGTDVIVTRKTTEKFLRERMNIDFLLLGKPFYVDSREGEKGEEGKVVHLGLHLPRAVLKKIFFENPRGILRIDDRNGDAQSLH